MFHNFKIILKYLVIANNKKFLVTSMRKKPIHSLFLLHLNNMLEIGSKLWTEKELTNQI